MDNAIDPPVPAVVCDGLVVRYGDTVAVDGLSFRAEAGQVTALLGPNGAGKTSTVETLEGYRRATAGTVRVLGLDPRADHAALVPRIGVMLQRGGVYPTLDSAQVLHLFARYYDEAEDPDALLEQVGLAGVRSTPWRRLSGGEQQRLSLALALVGKPDVVFLDEPTAGVDPEGRTIVRGIIEVLRRRGTCVVLTTHELPEAERPRASRIRAALLFLESYRELPLLAWPREVIDAIVSFEQAFVIFRQRHARMVERIIGRRTGTGGSSGVDYLDKTALEYRIFKEVWAVRTMLVRKSALPALENESFYAFAGGE